MAIESFASITLAELEAWVRAAGYPPYRAGQIMGWFYGKRQFDPAAMSNLPPDLRARLAAGFHMAPPGLVRLLGAADTTKKYLFCLADGSLIESVLIPASPALYGEASDRQTLCVSTQVGCAYGCRFCASGLDGFSRNLEAGEIVGQLLAAEAQSSERVSNLVFMGMGEPLANFGRLLRALEIFNAPWGCGIGARRMTVSTSGLAPEIRKLAEHPLQVRLAISLHGASDAVRGKIMPVNRKYPLRELLDACAHFCKRRGQMITFEYILIEGVNDALEEARLLAGHARRLRAKVNLIPYNRVEGLPWQRPSAERQRAFLRLLKDRGVAATLRIEKGHDIGAACGQLRLQAERAKRATETDSHKHLVC